MNFEHILFSIEDGVALLSLNRPEQLNSFNAAMHGEVREALKQVRQTPDARVLLLTGEGRGFCAGQDLSDRNVAPGAEMPDLGQSIEQFYNPLIRALRDLPLPVICAVNGVAAGAGTWAVVSDTAPKEAVGLAGAVFNCVGNIAGIVTPIVFGYIVATTGSYGIGLYFVAAHCILAALVFLLVMGRIERVGEGKAAA